MLSAEFLYEGTRYAYSFSYNTETEEFCEECFKRITIDQYGNRQETIYFLKTSEMGYTSVQMTNLLILFVCHPRIVC